MIGFIVDCTPKEKVLWFISSMLVLQAQRPSWCKTVGRALLRGRALIDSWMYWCFM